VKPNLFGIEFF